MTRATAADSQPGRDRGADAHRCRPLPAQSVPAQSLSDGSAKGLAVVRRIRRLWRKPSGPQVGLVLAGGGVIGGMYEVGVAAALEQHAFTPARLDVDVYVGSSAGSVVASVLANGVRASDLYRILDEDRLDPLNFRRTAVYGPHSLGRAVVHVSRLAWAVAKNIATGVRSSIPDMLARADGDVPAGLFSLEQLEEYLLGAFEARGLMNAFTDLGRTLLIPAVDLGRAERVVFGRGELAGVPIARAIAASSAIPGFFEPVAIDGRDYVDGGVGYSGHADLAVEEGADVVVVVNPLVPAVDEPDQPSLRRRGLYFILEQASRISSQNLLLQHLAIVAASHPETAFFLIQPPARGTPLFGLSMGFEASRAALRYGYRSTTEWLAVCGADLTRQLARTA